MNQAWVYVLHFDLPLSHAKHYTGCTRNLKQRLLNHARGHGSRLTRELYDRGIPWRLAGLYQTNDAAMRRIERNLKDHHDAARWCPICMETTYRPPDAIPYDIGLLPFATESKRIYTPKLWPEPVVSVCNTQPGDSESPRIVQGIKRLMQAEGTALGFIPIGGTAGLHRLIDTGQVALLWEDGEIRGYTATTFNPSQDALTIHQACVDEARRFHGYGCRLVNFVSAQRPGALQRCKVRDDLPANSFWLQIGFKQQGSIIHQTSGHQLNKYERVNNGREEAEEHVQA